MLCEKSSQQAEEDWNTTTYLIWQNDIKVEINNKRRTGWCGKGVGRGVQDGADSCWCMAKPI